MNILFDTNVLLDAMLDREHFGKNAVFLINAVEHSLLNGFLCADSISTIYYLIEKVKSKVIARQKVKLILEIFDVAPINRAVLEEALHLHFSDFEDAIVYQSAIGINADGIVTRNSKDYKKSKITIYSPVELISAIANL